MIICEKCGAQNDESFHFCASCGAAMMEKNDPSETMKEEKFSEMQSMAQVNERPVPEESGNGNVAGSYEDTLPPMPMQQLSGQTDKQISGQEAPSNIASDREMADPCEEEEESGTSGMAISSMVLGIVSIVFCWTGVIGIICGLLALIFSLVAFRKISREGVKGKGFAIAGIVCGIVGLVLSILMIIVTLAVFNTVWNSPEVQQGLRELDGQL